jgi:6-phosphofructokinase
MEFYKMSDVLKANAVISQGGGPTAVINASLVGVIEEAKKHPQIKNIYGSVHSVAGIVKDEFIDLRKLSAKTLELVAQSPSSALGSSRDKPDKEYCERIFDIFRKRNVRYYFYIGGNDSASNVNIINNMAAEDGFEMRAFHVPKTIDNDLLVTDHCPGYGSAAKFVASALIGDDLDNRALPGIKIDCIMGRHAGFLTAAAALAKSKEDDGPHLVYFPERPVSMDKFLGDVEAVYKKYKRCVVAVSEGICDTDGKVWAEKIAATHGEVDAHGNIQLSGSGALADFLATQVRSKLNIKRVRADTFGYLQRSFAGLQSPVDVKEARLCGRAAVKYAMKETSGSVAIKRLAGKRYKIELFLTELKNVAEKTKSMPAEFINSDGNGVTEAFVNYALPLTGGVPKTTFLGDNPRV